MLRKILFVLSLSLVFLFGAACSLIPSADPPKVEEEAPASTIGPGRPDAPPPVDGDFRADSADLVAATGRPQLVEFFAFW